MKLSPTKDFELISEEMDVSSWWCNFTVYVKDLEFLLKFHSVYCGFINISWIRWSMKLNVHQNTHIVLIRSLFTNLFIKSTKIDVHKYWWNQNTKEFNSLIKIFFCYIKNVLCKKEMYMYSWFIKICLTFTLVS